MRMDTPLDQMGKSLEKMNEAELGKLFPIILSDPDPEWAGRFQFEKAEIRKALGAGHIIGIEHIGSTAIPGIKAKSSIDILVEIKENTPDQHVIEQLQQSGYNFIPRPDNPPPHMMFVKGYTREGFRGQAYHIHVRYQGDWDEIHFRDYLVFHPDEAKKYEDLKIRLSITFKNDREGYTEAKTEFIRAVNEKARIHKSGKMEL
jgi:GrpB-like predicted nucleotidyltransferase (UPF0157 family)